MKTFENWLGIMAMYFLLVSVIVLSSADVLVCPFQFDIQFLFNQTVHYETFRGVVLRLGSTKVVRGKSHPIRNRSKQFHTVHLVAMGTSRY